MGREVEMKINKIFSIDHEIVLKLKEEKNASALINNLLNAHYGQGKLTKEMIQMKIDEMEKSIRDTGEDLIKARTQLEEASKSKSLSERISYG